LTGIVGFIGGSISSENPTLLNSMCQEIQYVESDLTDIWSDEYFSIARVHHGIINHQKQPVYNEDKTLLIFMDGEVFDYDCDKKFLLNKGHCFEYRNNDAEFCLHLFEELGEKAFLNLNGSFLIAIYDCRTKELILVNDRFSSCPLFYYSANGILTFGAQLKALLQLPQIPRKLDDLAVAEFFTFQRVLGTKTYYEDIKILSPASILKYRNGKISFEKYWEINYQEYSNKPEKYYIEALADALRDAVKSRTNDDFRYGILLSGGLDARCILAASDLPITTFTLGDFENREVKIAKKISESKGCKHIFLQRDINYYPGIVKKAVELGDGMFTFQHAHFTGYLQKIQKESDIVLHGYSFDIFYKGKYLPRKKVNIFGKKIIFPILIGLTKKNLLKAIMSMSGISIWDEKPNLLFTKDFYADLNDRLEKSVASILKEGLYHAKNYYNLFDYMETHFIYKNYGFLNQICIKNFMNERTIAFDNNLFNIHLEIPYRLRFGMVYKKALKSLNLELAKIPYANTGLSPLIPEPLELGIMLGNKLIQKIWSPKLPHPAFTQGSWPNMAELMRHNKKMQQLIWDVINDERCLNPDVFRRSVLTEIFNNHINYRGNYEWILILILTFGIWYKKYGPG
jgi:asparagine synthase (glutamine-hydrolysing)